MKTVIQQQIFERKIKENQNVDESFIHLVLDTMKNVSVKFVVLYFCINKLPFYLCHTQALNPFTTLSRMNVK